MSKGASEITTAALYVGITITAIGTALTVGVPTLENMQDAAAISNAESVMEAVDSNVQEVISEGEGSTRTVDIDIDRGELFFDERRNSLVYELETGAEVISPQTSTRDGDIVLSSNAQVKVNETEKEIDGEMVECYLMENRRVSVCIEKVDEPTFMDNSELLLSYKFIDDGEEQELDGELAVEVNEKEDTREGDITTEVEETGEFIGTGEVVATVQATDGGSDFGYDIIYRLPTGADFLQVDVQQ